MVAPSIIPIHWKLLARVSSSSQVGTVEGEEEEEGGMEVVVEGEVTGGMEVVEVVS